MFRGSHRALGGHDEVFEVMEGEGGGVGGGLKPGMKRDIRLEKCQDHLLDGPLSHSPPPDHLSMAALHLAWPPPG